MAKVREGSRRPAAISNRNRKMRPVRSPAARQVRAGRSMRRARAGGGTRNPVQLGVQPGIVAIGEHRAGGPARRGAGLGSPAPCADRRHPGLAPRRVHRGHFHPVRCRRRLCRPLSDPQRTLLGTVQPADRGAADDQGPGEAPAPPTETAAVQRTADVRRSPQ